MPWGQDLSGQSSWGHESARWCVSFQQGPAAADQAWRRGVLQGSLGNEKGGSELGVPKGVITVVDGGFKGEKEGGADRTGCKVKGR